MVTWFRMQASLLLLLVCFIGLPPARGQDIFSVIGGILNSLSTPATQTCVNNRGQQCVFPFTYQDQVFDSCTTFGSTNGQPWCATRVDRDGRADCGTGGCDDCSGATCGGGPMHPSVNCYDELSNCRDLAQTNCKRWGSQCKKSCGLCEGDTPHPSNTCYDRFNNCHQLCGSAWHAKHCRRSCGTC